MADPRNYNDPNVLKKAPEESRFVFNDYQRSKDLVVDPRRDLAEEHYKAYRAAHDLTEDGVMTQIVSPLIYTNVEEALPRLVANLPRVEIGPRKMPEDETRATKHRNLIFWDWDILRMAFKLILIAKGGEIFGTQWSKSTWKKRVETRMGRAVVPTVMGNLGLADFANRFGANFATERIEFVAQNVPVYNDPDISLPWIDEVFPEPGKADPDSCRYIIHRVKTSLHEIKGARKDGRPLYKPRVVSQLEKLMQGGNPVAEPVRTLEQMVRQDFKNESDTWSNDPHNREVHLLEWWSDTKVVVVVEEFPQLPPLRLEYNEIGRKPFNIFTPVPDIGNLYGISMSETLLGHQVMQSLLNGVTIDNLLYSVHQMWLVTDPKITAQNLYWRPGGLIRARDANAVTPLQKSGTDFSIYRTLAELDRQAQKAGFTDPFVGAPQGGTATEASLLFEASQSRLNLMFQILSLQYLTEWGRLNVRLNELFMDEDKPVQVMGDDYTPSITDIVRPEELLTGTGLDLSVKIDITQTEPTNRAFRLARAKDMLVTLGQIGFPIQHPVMQFVVAELLRGYGKDKPETLLGSGGNQQAALIEQLAAQAAAGGQGGSDAGLGNAAEALAIAAEDASPEISNQTANNGGIESAGDLIF